MVLAAGGGGGAYLARGGDGGTNGRAPSNTGCPAAAGTATSGGQPDPGCAGGATAGTAAKGGSGAAFGPSRGSYNGSGPVGSGADGGGGGGGGLYGGAGGGIADSGSATIRSNAGGGGGGSSVGTLTTAVGGSASVTVTWSPKWSEFQDVDVDFDRSTVGGLGQQLVVSATIPRPFRFASAKREAEVWIGGRPVARGDATNDDPNTPVIVKVPSASLHPGSNQVTVKYGWGGQNSYYGEQTKSLNYVATDLYTFSSVGASTKQLLTVKDNAKTDGAVVTTWNEMLAGNKTAGELPVVHQTWQYRPSAANPGWGELVGQDSRRCLQRNGSDGKIDQWTCGGSSNHLWRMVEHDGSWYLQLKHNGGYLGVQNERDPHTATNGSMLILTADPGDVGRWIPTPQVR